MRCVSRETVGCRVDRLMRAAEGGGGLSFAKSVIAQQPQGCRFPLRPIGDCLAEHTDHPGGLFIMAGAPEQLRHMPRKQDLDLEDALALSLYRGDAAFHFILVIHVYPFFNPRRWKVPLSLVSKNQLTRCLPKRFHRIGGCGGLRQLPTGWC